jgi:hypothetical protein
MAAFHALGIIKFLRFFRVIVSEGDVVATAKMSSKRVLECPFCDEILVVDPPDTLHSAYSTRKPISNSYYGDVVQQKLHCSNSNCKKQIVVYWYAPLEYFLRV